MNNLFEKITAQLSSIILGKEHQIRLCLCCLFARGHLLIDDLPGIGKTTLAKALAQTLGLEFKRIQCTNDMLPGDILGVSIFNQKSSEFVFHKGPIFTQVLLSDEINRTTPKTQSALLEAMEEQQATIEGKTYILPAPFFVIATQNPLEQSGTFPLPESQLDRFLFRLSIGYPDSEAETSLLRQGGMHNNLKDLPAVIDAKDVLEIQSQIEKTHTSEALLKYVQSILTFTRSSGHFQIGLSPRAGLNILRAARSWAQLNSRNHVEPEDVQEVLPYIMAHRLRSAKSYREFKADELLSIISEIAIP